MVKSTEGDPFLSMNETLARVLAYASVDDWRARYLANEVELGPVGVRTTQEIDPRTGETYLHVTLRDTQETFHVTGIDSLCITDPQIANALYQDRFANDKRKTRIPYEGKNRRSHE